jgi:hypothetical protein
MYTISMANGSGNIAIRRLLPQMAVHEFEWPNG